MAFQKNDHPSSYYDLHLVRHRLREILERAESPNQELYLDDLVDDIYRVNRLVEGLLRGYEADAAPTSE